MKGRCISLRFITEYLFSFSQSAGFHDWQSHSTHLAATVGRRCARSPVFCQPLARIAHGICDNLALRPLLPFTTISQISSLEIGIPSACSCSHNPDVRISGDEHADVRTSIRIHKACDVDVLVAYLPMA